MTRPIRIWICAAYHPAYRCGGWAAVRVAQGRATGAAGGERGASARRMALSGLVAGLRDPSPGDQTSSSPIRIHTTSPDLAAFADFLAGMEASAQAGAPEDDLDLWAQIAAAAKGRRLGLVHEPLAAGAAMGFACAWAELARDKAKASGAFASAIPQNNLARIAWPDAE